MHKNNAALSVGFSQICKVVFDLKKPIHIIHFINRLTEENPMNIPDAEKAFTNSNNTPLMMKTFSKL